MSPASSLIRAYGHGVDPAPPPREDAPDARPRPVRRRTPARGCYLVRQRARFSPLFFRQTSFVPEDEVAVEPTAAQNSPARAVRPLGTGLCEYQRGRLSAPRLRQRAHDPLEVLPTAPAVPQNLPTLTTPGTVTEALGAAVRTAGGDGLARLADALAATVDACFFTPHPVSATAALKAMPTRASGRFIVAPRARVPIRD
jgi:hypothetical protein